jgi:hypothetical protein
MGTPLFADESRGFTTDGRTMQTEESKWFGKSGRRLRYIRVVVKSKNRKSGRSLRPVLLFMSGHSAGPSNSTPL